MDGDVVAGAEFVGDFCGLTVYENVGGVDEFLDAGAGEVGAVGGNDAVEALVEVVGGGEEVVSHWVRRIDGIAGGAEVDSRQLKVESGEGQSGLRLG